jgi:type IV pilus assembly protein PilB
MTKPAFIELITSRQQVITADQAWHFGIIPKEVGNDQVEFYVDETRCTPELQEEIALLLGKDVLLQRTDPELILSTLGKYYRKNGHSMRSRTVAGLSLQQDDLLGKLISDARSIHSSDIHIETYENRARVRMRIDGKLVERYEIGKPQYPALINKIKIQANLDIAEKRLPQDGRILYGDGEDQFDIRVSIIPTLYGEKTVLRLLSKDSTRIIIEELGFSEKQCEDYLEAIRKTSGIILISGPTGSGKTTTLYATLKILNREESNILTIEDPVEYTLEGVNQVQLKESIGLSFAAALRTFLRQDPDIIMLGEIRDGETAQMAIRSALTGHLVLSTIHTNSAWGTIARLADMGVPPFLLAGTLNLSVSQRLVRLLCPHCKKKVPFNPAAFPRGYKPISVPGEHWIPVGCPGCFFTGYKSRKAVFEVIPLDGSLSDKIKRQELDAEQYLRETGIEKMSDSALRLFIAGETTIDEIYPILMNDAW